MAKKIRLPKQSMLALEQAILNGDFVLNRTQKKLPYIKEMRKAIYNSKMKERKKILRERYIKRNSTKHFSIFFPGRNYMFRTKFGRSDRPVSSRVYMGFGSFSFNLTIPEEILPAKNPKIKIMAAYEDQVMQYFYDNIEKLCVKNEIKQTVIRSKTSKKVSMETMHKPHSIKYTLKMCDIDKKKITAKIKKHIKITKGKKYYD